MSKNRTYFGIREGEFDFFIVTDQLVSIERRNRGVFELANDGGSSRVAWLSMGTLRIPVYRLGRLFSIEAADWEYVLVLSDGTSFIGLAAEDVHLIPETTEILIQPFNPAGVRNPGRKLITGVCPNGNPEFLVLDPVGIQNHLRRSG